MGKILCLDFDGVLHSYSSGWKGIDVIPDPITSGAVEFLEKARKEFEIHVFSSRSKEPRGVEAMKKWLANAIYLHYATLFDDKSAGERAQRLFYSIHWDTEKPAAFLTIDDRAIQFTGEWPSVQALMEFKPWNK